MFRYSWSHVHCVRFCSVLSNRVRCCNVPLFMESGHQTRCQAHILYLGKGVEYTEFCPPRNLIMLFPAHPKVRLCGVLLTAKSDSVVSCSTQSQTLWCPAVSRVIICRVLLSAVSYSVVSCSLRCQTLWCPSLCRVRLYGVLSLQSQTLWCVWYWSQTLWCYWYWSQTLWCFWY